MPQQNERTALTPSEEAAFQRWAKQNKIADLDDPRSFYDYRGFWKESGGTPIRFGIDHFPDTFKQHGHPTFSVESKYSRGPNDGGTWQGETFIPPKLPKGSGPGTDDSATVHWYDIWQNDANSFFPEMRAGKGSYGRDINLPREPGRIVKDRLGQLLTNGKSGK